MTIEDFRERRGDRRRIVFGDRCLCGHFESCHFCTPVMKRQEIAGGYAWGALKRPDGTLVMQADYERHTIDSDVQAITDTLRKDRLWAWCAFWALVGAIMGYMVGRFVLPAWVGG